MNPGILPVVARASSGETYTPSAAVHNALVDSHNQAALSRTLAPSAGIPAGWGFPCLVANVRLVNVQNPSAGDVFRIVTTNEPYGIFPEFPLEAARRPILQAAKPAGIVGESIVVAMESANIDRVIRVCVQGVAYTRVNITDEDHEYAEARTNDHEKLYSANGGSIRIVAKESSGTGLKTCLVYVGFSLGGESGRWIRCTSATATSGTYPAVLIDKDGSGGREDGEVVRFKLIAGDTVVNGGYYWATHNGTQDISSVTYDVYDGIGNDQEYVTDCDEGVDGYRIWKIPHPWEVGSFTAGDPP